MDLGLEGSGGVLVMVFLQVGVNFAGGMRFRGFSCLGAGGVFCRFLQVDAVHCRCDEVPVEVCTAVMCR